MCNLPCDDRENFCATEEATECHDKCQELCGDFFDLSNECFEQCMSTASPCFKYTVCEDFKFVPPRYSCFLSRRASSTESNVLPSQSIFTCAPSAKPGADGKYAFRHEFSYVCDDTAVAPNINGCCPRSDLRFSTIAANGQAQASTTAGGQAQAQAQASGDSSSSKISIGCPRHCASQKVHRLVSDPDEVHCECDSCAEDARSAYKVWYEEVSHEVEWTISLKLLDLEYAYGVGLIDLTGMPEDYDTPEEWDSAAVQSENAVKVDHYFFNGPAVNVSRDSHESGAAAAVEGSGANVDGTGVAPQGTGVDTDKLVEDPHPILVDGRTNGSGFGGEATANLDEDASARRLTSLPGLRILASDDDVLRATAGALVSERKLSQRPTGESMTTGSPSSPAKASPWYSEALHTRVHAVMEKLRVERLLQRRDGPSSRGKRGRGKRGHGGKRGKGGKKGRGRGKRGKGRDDDGDDDDDWDDDFDTSAREDPALASRPSTATHLASRPSREKSETNRPSA